MQLNKYNHNAFHAKTSLYVPYNKKGFGILFQKSWSLPSGFFTFFTIWVTIIPLYPQNHSVDNW